MKTKTLARRARGRMAAAAQRGMTLIEIMVVVLIMGLIMGAVGYAVFRMLARNKVKTTRIKVKRVLGAVQTYMEDTDIEKTSEDGCPPGLEALSPEFIGKKMLRDAWAKPLKLQCSAQKICVYSSGPNKSDENGGGDDIKACDGSKEEDT